MIPTDEIKQFLDECGAGYLGCHDCPPDIQQHQKKLIALCRELLGGVKHIAHSKPTERHAIELFSTAINTLTRAAEIVRGNK